MRTPAEILFRLRQESMNALFLARPPRLENADSRFPLAILPDPEPVAKTLRGGSYARDVTGIAEECAARRIPLLGRTFTFNEPIDWRADFVSGKTSPADYFKLIPYLDAEKVGDHKYIWELNRHQFLIPLAQAALFTNDARYVRAIEQYVTSWLDSNPFLRGINWCSALEVAFRALSWIWTLHIAGHRIEPGVVRRMLQSLYQHGCYLERNLSFYFSPNTHLLGEAVALHALGRAFPHWPRSRRWTQLGATTTSAQFDRQIEEDGSHFEQSSYYHVYALDFFLLHAVVSGSPLSNKLQRMAEYLDGLLGPDRAMPFLGDDDGGRLFHPYGGRARFGRATLATCGCLLGSKQWPANENDLAEQAAWWIGEAALANVPRAAAPVGRCFQNSGLVTLAAPGVYVWFDAGPLGRASGGHSHADSLSVVVCKDGEELLIDPGTFSYADAEWRERFRGTSAHNTIRIDGREQASPAGPFRWKSKPEVKLLQRTEASASAICTVGGASHIRTVRLESSRLLIEDRIEGAREVEQFWRPGAPVRRIGAHSFRIGSAQLLCDPALEVSIADGWRSSCYGIKEPSPVIRATGPAGTFRTELRFDAAASEARG